MFQGITSLLRFIIHPYVWDLRGICVNNAPFEGLKDVQKCGKIAAYIANETTIAIDVLGKLNEIIRELGVDGCRGKNEEWNFKK